MQKRRDPPPPLRARASTLFDRLLLSTCCLIAYFTGLTNHGLTNWQESQRALVAREMQRSGDWLVPTINNQPYLAKPPMFYWIQVGLAELRSVHTSEFELRFAVALAGLIGVLATYWVVRELFAGREASNHAPGIGRQAALWSGLFLCTGFLYARSSRIGELDIWLAPFVTLAIGCILRAWRRCRENGRTDYPFIVLAILAATGAALTKGPPGIAVIAAAGYGSIALDALLRRREDDYAQPHTPQTYFPTALSLLFALGAAIVALPKAHNFGEVLGAAILVIICGVLGRLLAKALTPPTRWSIVRTFSKTHPVAVLGLPLLALWGWGKLVGQRIGPEAAAFWAQKETDDNLQVLIPESPIKNLEAMSFGVGLGSILSIAAIWWLLSRGPRLTIAWLVPIAWVGLGFALFSLFGKGIGRYLTPLWPGVAILAGIWLSTMLARDLNARRTRIVLALLVALMVIANGIWYGFGRERADSARSPRALIAELINDGHNPARMATFEYWSAALDFYAGHRVQPVGDMQIRSVTAGGSSWSLTQLADDIKSNGDRIIFIRATQPVNRDRDPRLAIDRLREAGLLVEVLNTRARMTVDTGKSDFIPARVRVNN